MAIGDFPEQKLAPDFLARALVAMKACADCLGRDPEEATLSIGDSKGTKHERPNYQVLIGRRSFVFDSTHHPFQGSLPKGPPVAGQLRDGPFGPVTEARSFDEVAELAKAACSDPQLVLALAELSRELAGFSASAEAGQGAPAGDRGVQQVLRKLRDRRFRARVLQCQAAVCAVCDEDIADCLDAAHIHEVGDDGDDEPDNGLLLCALHHRMFDKHFFGLDKDRRAVASKRYSLGRLRITRTDVDRADLRPEALAHRWKAFEESEARHGGVSPAR